MTKTTNSTRIAALEATVAGQAETIEHLLERIERITDRVNFVKKWNRQQDKLLLVSEARDRLAKAKIARARYDYDVQSGYVPFYEGTKRTLQLEVAEAEAAVLEHCH